MNRDERQAATGPYTEKDLHNIDVYTADGQLVGTFEGFAYETPEDRRNMERGPVDTLDSAGNLTESRRLIINGYGYPAQVEISVPEDQVDIDLRGRRMTLQMTMAQIRDMPHRDSFTPANPPVNAGASELGYADPDLL